MLTIGFELGDAMAFLTVLFNGPGGWYACATMIITWIALFAWGGGTPTTDADTDTATDIT